MTGDIIGAGDRWAFRLLAAITPPRDRDALLGDLLEEHSERGGLTRESLRAIAPVLALRIHRAGGFVALGFACLAGLLAGYAVVLAFAGLWQQVLFNVPFRAAGPQPLTWRLAALAPALLSGAFAARVALGFAVRLLGGRT